MSHVMRKPINDLCERQRRRSACASTQSDQCYANNKGADQPAHPRSLISAFIVRCLDSMIPLFAISENSRLASFWSRAAWFESRLVGNPEGKFSHDVAHQFHGSYLHTGYNCAFSSECKSPSFVNITPKYGPLLAFSEKESTQTLFKIWDKIFTSKFQTAWIWGSDFI